MSGIGRMTDVQRIAIATGPRQWNVPPNLWGVEAQDLAQAVGATITAVHGLNKGSGCVYIETDRDMRWLGESNGYYSEEPYMCWTTDPSTHNSHATGGDQ